MPEALGGRNGEDRLSRQRLGVAKGNNERNEQLARKARKTAGKHVKRIPRAGDPSLGALRANEHAGTRDWC